MAVLRGPYRRELWRPGRWRPPRRRRAPRVMIAIGAALGALAVMHATGFVSLDPLLRVRTVNVTIAGCGALTTDEIRTAVGVTAGCPWSGLDWDQACHRVQALPRVRSVRLSYGVWHRLDVHVTERIATALVLGRDGRALEVSADGVLLQPRGSCLADLPLLSWVGSPACAGLDAGMRVEVTGARDALATLALLRQGHPVLWDSISQVHLMGDGSYELYWNDVPTVAWARGRLSGARCSAWVDVMEDLRRRGEEDVVVDLRFHEQILVRFPTATTG